MLLNNYLGLIIGRNNYFIKCETGRTKGIEFLGNCLQPVSH